MHTISVQPMPLTNFPYEKIVNGDKYQWTSRDIEEWFYDYEKYTIWGLTVKGIKTFYRDNKVNGRNLIAKGT